MTTLDIDKLRKKLDCLCHQMQIRGLGFDRGGGWCVCTRNGKYTLNGSKTCIPLSLVAEGRKNIGDIALTISRALKLDTEVIYAVCAGLRGDYTSAHDVWYRPSSVQIACFAIGREYRIKLLQ